MLSSSVFAQKDSLKVPKNAQLSTDKLGNLFVITPNNDILKYDINLNLIATTNFKVLGNIASIDVSNPFEIYVFYRDQNKLLLLDNLLNQLALIDIEATEISQIACLSRSFDNHIWIFDLSDLKLKKYSKDLKMMIQSAAFNVLPIFNEINPSKIIDNNSNLLILNNGSILQFDVFGNFNKTIISDSISQFQAFDNNIVYLKNNQLFVYNSMSFKFSEILTDKTIEIKNFRIEKERLYILTDDFVILQPFK